MTPQSHRAPEMTLATASSIGAGHRARQLGWAAAFLLTLAALLFPSILLAARLGHAISMFEQAALIACATIIVQRLRSESLWRVTGPPDVIWLRDLARGCGLGALLMLVPALVLWLCGAVHFVRVGTNAEALARGILTMASVAVAEELLFRGVLFQRLVGALGAWPAQLAVGALFILTHLGNPGMTGATKVWAGSNIFLASIMFGIAFLNTRRLALPVGLHFMANVTQGMILGFGVSGNTEPRVLSPVFSGAPAWLTGGSFGLEASLPGLLAVAGMIGYLAHRRSRRA